MRLFALSSDTSKTFEKRVALSPVYNFIFLPLFTAKSERMFKAETETFEKSLTFSYTSNKTHKTIKQIEKNTALPNKIIPRAW
jgi:hypothetical protein